VARSEAEQALREVFRFDAADLAANRTGRLSARQAALLRARRAGMRLSLAVFAVVMLGSVGLLAFFNRRLDTPGGWSSGLGMAAIVAVAVIALGYLVSRGHLVAARSRQVEVAHGLVEVLSDTDDDCRVRIGPTPLKLATPAHLEAFRPAIEYRVHYIAGPVAFVLSAETLWERGATEPDADGAEHSVPQTVEDSRVVLRREFVIVLVLGALALGVPVAGVLVGSLPPGLRPAAWAGLLAIAIGFAWLAIAWLQPRQRPGP